MGEAEKPENTGEIVIYDTGTGETRLDVRLQNETVWLSQGQLAELYQCSKQNIQQHIKSIFADGELPQNRTVKQYLTVQTEGNRSIRRKIDYYNLEIIIAVGYRIDSPIATRFRQWATSRLTEYVVKGFTIDDERLKGTSSVTDHFDELLARIREIRASEARVYQRIREIFSMAADYREGDKVTLTFYATVQNKMHYAATGKTAAEIIQNKADATQPNMGLTSWKCDRVLKRDVGVAKNYLGKEEIDILNRITVMFLDQAEFRAMRRQDIHIADWEVFLDNFLKSADLPVLNGPGKVSHDQALSWAESQYELFAQKRREISEEEAERHYLNDLENSAKLIEEKAKRKTKNE